jgi:hypothetical protein
LGDREQGNARREEERLRPRDRRRPFTVEEGRPLGRRCVCPAARCRKVAIGQKGRANKKAARRLKVAPQIVVVLTEQELLQ